MPARTPRTFHWVFALLFTLAATRLLAAGDANDTLLAQAQKAYNQDDFTAARAALDKLLKAAPAATAAQRSAALLCQAKMLEEEGNVADALKQFDTLATDKAADPACAYEAGILWCRASLEHRIVEEDFRNRLEKFIDNPPDKRLEALATLEIARLFSLNGSMEMVMASRGELAQKRDAVNDPNEQALFDIFTARIMARGHDDDGFTRAQTALYDDTALKPNLRLQAAIALAAADLAHNRPKEALDWLAKGAKLPHPLPGRNADLQRYTAQAQAAQSNYTAAKQTLAKARTIANLPKPKLAELWMAEAALNLDTGDAPAAQKAVAAAQATNALNEEAAGDAKRIAAIITGKPVPKPLFDPAHPEIETDWYYKWLGAIKRDDAASLRALAQQGIDPAGTLDPNGSNALGLAAALGRANVLQALLELKVPVDSRDGEERSALMQAAQAGQLAMVQALLAAKADPTAHDKYNLTPLHFAASHGHLPIVKLLVEKKMDVNLKGENDWTPLHYAACYQHLDVVQYLVEHGADPAARGAHGETPAMLCARPDSPVYQYLAKANPAGANPDRIPGRGPGPAAPAKANAAANAALVAAAMEGSVDDAKKALAAGADVDTTDGEIARSPLIWAARQGNLDVVKLLIEKGADINQKDRMMGRTALDLANLRHNQELIDYLKSKNAKTATELK